MPRQPTGYVPCSDPPCYICWSRTCSCRFDTRPLLSPDEWKEKCAEREKERKREEAELEKSMKERVAERKRKEAEAKAAFLAAEVPDGVQEAVMRLVRKTAIKAALATLNLARKRGIRQVNREQIEALPELLEFSRELPDCQETKRIAQLFYAAASDEGWCCGEGYDDDEDDDE